MAADIGPELYDQILKKFNERYEKAQLFGEPVADVLARIKSGDATFRDADLYAVEVGSMISDSMKEVLKLDALPDKTLYYNIAKKTIEPALREEHRLVSDVARAVQDIYYDDLGIGLKAAAPEFNQKRSDTVVDNACQASTQEKLDASIDQPVKTFARAINDDAKKKNAGIQSKAGLQVTVTRIYDKVGLRRGTKHSERCSWCLERCDEDVPYDEALARGMFQRHDGCGCIIEYTSKKGERTVSTSKYGGFEKIEDPKEVEDRLIGAKKKRNSNAEIPNANSVNEAKEILKNRFGVTGEGYYDKINIEIANNINKELKKFYETFGNLKQKGVLDSIRVLDNPKADYEASYTKAMKEVGLLKHKVQYKNSVTKIKEEAVFQYKYGIWSSSDNMHFLRHELGHAVGYTLDTVKMKEIEDLRVDILSSLRINQPDMNNINKADALVAGTKISYYGLVSDKEFIAESIAEFMTGHPRETAKKVVEIILR